MTTTTPRPRCNTIALALRIQMLLLATFCIRTTTSAGAVSQSQRSACKSAAAFATSSPSFLRSSPSHSFRLQVGRRNLPSRTLTKVRSTMEEAEETVFANDAINPSTSSSPPPSDNGDVVESEPANYIPPWSIERTKAPTSTSFARFRQHVNPLSRRYQMSAELPDNWPYSDFTNVNLPLYLDIGCGKGGFLLELVGRRHGNSTDAAVATEPFPGVRNDSYMNKTKTLFDDTSSTWLPPEMNYIGLEIRPGVSQYAQARVEKRGLDGVLSFLGCNANVDLDRMLTLYREAGNDGGKDDSGDDSANEGEADDRRRPAFVSIQFPDPHFKKAHLKRRVVTAALVTTLAKFMKEDDGVVFLQSDIKEALEAMREKFVEAGGDGSLYFTECSSPIAAEGGGEQEYGMDNPLGIPTEREVSVLSRGLPVFRTMFRRNELAFSSREKK